MEEKKFRKLSKKQKLEMEINYTLEDVECSRVLFIPINKKMDGYGMSACFVKTPQGWLRSNDYDCFRISIERNYLQGDFEYGGIVFFLPEGSTLGFGNSIKIK